MAQTVTEVVEVGQAAEAVQPPRARSPIQASMWATYAIMIVISVAMLAPLYWLVLTSFKTSGDVSAFPPDWIPKPFSMEHYRDVFHAVPVGRFYLNTLIITIATVVGNVVLCTLAGYVLARKEFWGRELLFALVVGSLMVPAATRVIPNYLIVKDLGLLNTYAGIVLPSAATGFGIFMMRQFLRSIPRELDDAARIDGCGEWQVMLYVILPLAKPAIACLAIFSAVWSVEDFMWPMIATSELTMRPIQVGITLFLTGEYVVWGPIAAITVLASAPVVILYVALQRYFISGLTAGAVKG